MITYRLSKGHISNVVGTANCIKLKPLGLDERNVLLIKRQYVNAFTSNISTATVTLIQLQQFVSEFHGIFAFQFF